MSIPRRPGPSDLPAAAPARQWPSPWGPRGPSFRRRTIGSPRGPRNASSSPLRPKDTLSPFLTSRLTCGLSKMDRNGEERLDRKLGTRVPRGLHALWPSVRPWKPLSPPPEHPPSGWEQKQATLHLAEQVARSREGPHTVTSAPGSLQAEPHAGHHVLGRFPLRDCETGGSDLRAASPCLKFLDVKGIVRKVFPSETPAAGILIIHTGKKNANFFICRSSVGDSDLPQPGCSLGTSVRKWGVTSNKWQQPHVECRCP